MSRVDASVITHLSAFLLKWGRERRRSPGLEESNVASAALRVWSSFDPGAPSSTSSGIFARLQAASPSLKALRLSDLGAGHAEAIWSAISTASSIISDANSIALIRVSNVLHSWNPRLFLCLDRGFLWEWVLKEGFVWDYIEAVRARIEPALSDSVRTSASYDTELGWYLYITFWAADLLRQDSTILRRYHRLLDSDPLLADNRLLREYEAIACEWFLLGTISRPQME